MSVSSRLFSGQKGSQDSIGPGEFRVCHRSNSKDTLAGARDVRSGSKDSAAAPSAASILAGWAPRCFPFGSCCGPLCDRLFPGQEDKRVEFQRLLDFLDKVPLFRKQLPKADLPRVARALEKKVWRPDEKVIEQGKEGQAFFIIFSGEAQVMVRDPGGVDSLRATLHTADHFGGRTLTERRPNIATIMAKGPEALVTYYLSRAAFEQLGLHRKLRLPKRPALYEGRRIGDTLWRVGSGMEQGLESAANDHPSKADINLICTAAHENPNLSALMSQDREQVWAMASKGRRRKVEQGSDIIQSGEVGLEFYVIAEGSFAVLPDRRCSSSNSAADASGSEWSNPQAIAAFSTSAEAALASNSMARRMVRKQHFLMQMLKSVAEEPGRIRRRSSESEISDARQECSSRRGRGASYDDSNMSCSTRRHMHRLSEDLTDTMVLMCSETTHRRQDSKSFDSADDTAFQVGNISLSPSTTTPLTPRQEEATLLTLRHEEAKPEVKAAGEGSEDVRLEIEEVPKPSGRQRRSLKAENLLAHQRDYEEDEERSQQPAVVMSRGECLGELSMLYNTRQVATCRALEPSVVYAISRAHFKECFKREGPHFEEYMRLLDDVHMLTPLLRAERAELARNSLGFYTFRPGEVVIRQGETLSERMWYVIDRGLCIITKAVEQPGEKAQEPKVVAKLRRGGHFGERVILSKEKRYGISATAGPQGMTCLLIHGEILKALRLNIAEGEQKDQMDSPDVLHLRSNAGEYYEHVRSQISDNHDIQLSEMSATGLLGIGGFGSVFLMECGSQRFALKRMSKAFIEQADAVKQVCNERDILTMVDSPFIIRFFQSYRDAGHVYMRMEYAPGGHLFRLLIDNSDALLAERQGGSAAMFYVACVILAIEYLHERHIAYRDLKLENVLLDRRGYAKLCDLGFARFILGKSNTLLGTPAYMAPEMIDPPHAHDTVVDWWALGVFTFELLTGQGPWDNLGIDSDEPMGQMLAFRLSHDRGIPPGLLPQERSAMPVRNFISKLLCIKPKKRLGSKDGATEVKKHDWFEMESFNFEALQRQEVPAPHLPSELEEASLFEVGSDTCKSLWEEGEGNSRFERRLSIDGQSPTHALKQDRLARSLSSTNVDALTPAPAETSRRFHRRYSMDSTGVRGLKVAGDLFSVDRGASKEGAGWDECF